LDYPLARFLDWEGFDMRIITAGPTVVTSKAPEAVAFYETHFGLTANDYGAADAGETCWYWTLTFGDHAELSFMLPRGPESEFTGVGSFYSIQLGDAAAVDAQRQRLMDAGVSAPEPHVEDFMYQFWITDPAGLRLMIHSIEAND
jgi:predicted enzyme related to lactoylglutathione lyase